jgi:acyl-CoA reductase-like NAD-dependent aldehyde dehydrogenase
VLSILPGYGHKTGKEIVQNPLVRKVDITVSSPSPSYSFFLIVIKAGTETGRALGSIVGANLAAFTAELGGKVQCSLHCFIIKKSYLRFQAPILVFDDADLINAVNGTAFASFVASGQTCVSGTRILIQEQIYEKFNQLFLTKVKSIRARMGDRE